MCRVVAVSSSVVVFHVYLTIIVTLSDVLSQTNSPATCQHDSSEELPKIIPGPGTNHHDSSLDDESSANVSISPSKLIWSRLVYEDCKVQVEFECSASYPVEWVEHYDQNITKLTDVKRYIKKDLWTERTLQNETLVQVANLSFSSYSDALYDLPQSLTTYTAYLGISYQVTGLCVAANYTCQSVRKPCLQSSVISKVDLENETIRYQQIYEDYKDRDYVNPSWPCETKMEVAVSEKGRVGWKCIGSKKYPVVSPKLRDCDSASHCNTFFHHHKQQNCVKRIKSLEECTGCQYRNKSGGYLLHPGYIYCIDQASSNVLTAHQYFFSISQSLDEDVAPQLYLNWEEADPQKMLYLEPLSQPIFVGETRTMFCKISRFYFSYGYRFGFEYLNGTMQYSKCTDGVHDENQNVNILNITFTFTDLELTKLYCFAPVWNSTEWVNQSVIVNMRKDAIAPSFVSEISSSSLDQQVTLQLHEKNVTLPCEATGQPTPEIEWMFDNKDVEINQMDVKRGRKDLEFQYVSLSVAGKYKCSASNFLKTITKTFHVVVKDELAAIREAHEYKHKLWEGTIVFSAVFLSIFMVALGVCWRKVRRQRRQLRALTDDEVKEFRNGNTNVLGDSHYLDTQELLRAIPYNDEYEIPSKRLYIDPSEVLGCGNFGRVLKGVMYDGNDKRKCITVAVKTTKEKYDVSYFQTLLTEVKIMAYLGRHTNVVSLMGACTENIQNRQIFIAVEYCAKGSLEKFLKNNRSSFVNLVCDDTICITTSFCSENEQNHLYENSNTSPEFSTVDLLKWSREIANGMDFLGSKKIVHGDLAARNILLTQDLVAKIGDFGLSRVLMTYSNYIRSNQDDCILPWKWMAIETLYEMKFSVMSDAWSFGVTLWEIFSLAQHHPYPGASYNSGFLDWLKNGHRLSKPFYANSQIYNLMMECWAYHPNQRPAFTEIKDFFDGLLLQTCDIEYVRTKLCGATQYMDNLSANPSVQNPGYLVLGHGTLPLEEDYDETVTQSDMSSIQILTASEDNQGYLKPLMTDFGYDMKA